MRPFFLSIRPDGQFVSIRIGEMKTASAGKGEYGDADLPTGCLDTPVRILDIGGVKNDKRSTLG